MITIRQAVIEDTESVYQLVCELENEELNKERFNFVFNKNINNPTIAYFVALVDAKIIGFGSVHLQDLLHHTETVAEIQELIITQTTQMQGVGSLLVRYIENWAKAKDTQLIEVTANQKRKQAHLFYSKHSYKNTHFKFTKTITQNS